MAQLVSMTMYRQVHLIMLITFAIGVGCDIWLY